MLEAVVGVLGTAMLGIFGWAFHLNSEVNVQKQRYDDLLKLVDTKFEALIEIVDTKFDASNQRLERIERALNGALHRS